jgi:aminomethyltransferase
MTQESLRTSPLDATHRSLSARMAPFAGWEMPIQYSGIVQEVRAVRQRAGIFDVSHMGRLFLTGPDAVTLLRETLTYDAAKVDEGQGHYNLLCNERGGIIDDPYIYRLSRERWLFVGNASRYETDVRWVQGHRRSNMNVLIDDRQASTTMLAVQGPGAKHAIAAVFTADLEAHIPKRACHEIELFGHKALVSRTGYTGEDGFEFICSIDAGRALWDSMLSVGVVPCGLGARDVLRLEAALPLYGNDIDTTTNPWEAGLGWVVSLADAERQFEGRRALENARGAVGRKLVCIKATDRAVLRHGYPVLAGGGQAGTLTSGTFSPSINAGIGMAYLPPAFAEPGTTVAVDVRGRSVPGMVVKRPFYRGGA